MLNYNFKLGVKFFSTGILSFVLDNVKLMRKLAHGAFSNHKGVTVCCSANFENVSSIVK